MIRIMALIIILLNPTKDDLIEYIDQTATAYSICPETIEAMIEIESEWDAEAVSSCGAIGLMQIVPKWQTDRMDRLGIDDLSNPYQNILCGIDYLAELCETYGNIEEALMFYNMGYRGIELYEAGIISQYAEDVLALSMELEKKHEQMEAIWKKLRLYRMERLNAILMASKLD